MEDLETGDPLRSHSICCEARAPQWDLSPYLESAVSIRLPLPHERLLEPQSRCSGRPWTAVGAWAGTASANIPGKKLKCKEGGHVHEVSRSLGVKLPWKLDVPPVRGPGHGHIGIILS